MIQHIALNPKNKQIVIQSCGWGKVFTRPGKTNSTDAELIAWQKWAEAHIVLEKLKGYVQARAIAFEAKHHTDPVAKGYIKMLLYFMDTVKSKGCEAIYKMVVAHELKFMALLPYKENAMNVYVPEIIAFCKLKTKS